MKMEFVSVSCVFVNASYFILEARGRKLNWRSRRRKRRPQLQTWMIVRMMWVSSCVRLRKGLLTIWCASIASASVPIGTSIDFPWNTLPDDDSPLFNAVARPPGVVAMRSDDPIQGRKKRVRQLLLAKVNSPSSKEAYRKVASADELAMTVIEDTLEGCTQDAVDTLVTIYKGCD